MAAEYFDPLETAKKALGLSGNTLDTSSLTPTKTIDYSSLLPTYTPPERKEFDWSVPMSERPAGTENWTWSRNIKAKQLWDAEQDKIQDNAYKKWQTEYQAAKDYINLLNEQNQQKLSNINAQLTAAGLTPLASLDDLPSAQIRLLGQAWQNTTDQNLRDQYHQLALQIAQKAGMIPEGYTGSVNGYANLSLAGTPTAESKLAQEKLDYQKEKDAQDYALNYYKTLKSGSSGSGGSSGKTLTPWQQYQIAEAESKKENAETKAFKDYLTKFKNGGNARRYLQKFGSQGNVDTAAVATWAAKYFGDSWFDEPTIDFDKYGKAIAIKQKK